MMKLSGAIFDMDGTLIDSLIFWDILWEEFSRRYGYFRPDPEADRTIRTISMKNAMYYIHDRFGLGHDGEELYRLANGMLEAFYEQQVELKPGVMEFLTRCRALGVKMCVATATDRYLVDAALTRCGVRQYFSEIFTCTEVGSGKDEPEIFRRALAFLGENRQNTVIFEDALYAVKTAKADGFFVCAVYDPHERNADTLRALADMYVMGMDEPENNAG